MEFLEQLLSVELGLPARFIIAFVVVLVLIALTAWLLRRISEGRSGLGSVRTRQQRLAIIDSANIDTKRRLVLIRRDNVEHLVLIGGPSDVVIESGIGQKFEHQTAEAQRTEAHRQVPPAAGPAVATVPPAEQPRPAVVPPAPRPLRATPPPAGPAPRVEPTVRPAGLSPATPRPQQPPQPAPEPRVSAGGPPPRAEPGPAPEPRPAPPEPRESRENRRADPQLEEMAQRLEAALKRPIHPGAQPAPQHQPAPPPPTPQPALPVEAPPRTAPDVDLAAALATELEPGEDEQPDAGPQPERRAPPVSLYNDEDESSGRDR